MQKPWQKRPLVCHSSGNPLDLLRSPRFARRALPWIILCCLFSGAPIRALAQSDDEGEYRLKLAFLYHFTEFVDWPSDAFQGDRAPLTICVLGEDPFANGIKETLRGRAVAGHPIDIRRLKPAENPRGCQVVFVRSGEKRASERVLASLKSSSILTVGETKGFAERGGIINLFMDENKLRFEINLGAAKQANLRISSKLLALAKLVPG